MSINLAMANKKDIIFCLTQVMAAQVIRATISSDLYVANCIKISLNSFLDICHKVIKLAEGSRFEKNNIVVNGCNLIFIYLFYFLYSSVF